MRSSSSSCVCIVFVFVGKWWWFWVRALLYYEWESFCLCVRVISVRCNLSRLAETQTIWSYSSANISLSLTNQEASFLLSMESILLKLVRILHNKSTKYIMYFYVIDRYMLYPFKLVFIWFNRILPKFDPFLNLCTLHSNSSKNSNRFNRSQNLL